MDWLQTVPSAVRALVSVLTILAFAAITATAFNRKRFLIPGLEPIRSKPARIVWLCWGAAVILIFLGRLWGFIGV